MATREQIIHDISDATRGLSLQDRATIKIMAQSIKAQIQETANRLDTDNARIAYAALLNVVGDLVANLFPPEEEAEIVRQIQTLIPMYVAAYRQKEKTL